MSEVDVSPEAVERAARMASRGLDVAAETATLLRALSTELQQARERLEASEARVVGLERLLSSCSAGMRVNMSFSEPTYTDWTHMIEAIDAALPADGPGDTP